MKHIITIISIIILITSNAFSQVIKGTIKDKETNKPLPGVNIALVKKKTTGTITDLNGEYSLSVPEGINMLEFRFIGYETIKKTFQMGRGDTITFDTTLTEEAELAIDYMCLFIPSMSYIDFVKEFYQSDGIFFFNNNYLKYYKQDGYDELTMGIHFQPEITKRLSPAFTIEGMCDLRAISMQNHNTENNLNVKPHFRLKYQTYSFDFKIGYNKAIERQEMPDQLYGLDHYYFSEVNDGFSITYNNIFKSSIWLDCINNNIFDNKWNKDALWGWNLSKTIRADNFLRNMRFYADVLVANHSYVADNNQKFVHNLESGMYGIVFDILHYRPVINTLAPKKLTTIIYEIKYAQSHFFDNNAILYHKSGNGILNNLRIKFAQSVILDMGHFYAKNYASTYSNPVYNCYATAKPEISVLSLGASYQKWTGKYHGNFYCGLSAYARIYQDFINSQFSYTVGANLVLVPAIRFSR
ncbi:MAG: carboxypeptidase-like regulatory domain-containing protein [Alphaproteobacteria bacterium]|nr:carboxypeptidase-like regulatory domain-containing protein [Alphaproteobacteria bacterium]